MSADTSSQVPARVRAWRLAAAAGDPSRFARRLAHLGLGEADLDTALLAPEPQGPPARWVVALCDVAESAADCDTDPPTTSRPLADLLTPLRRYASDRLPDSARPGCTDFLERRLETLMSPVVDAEFRRHKTGDPDGEWADWVRGLHRHGLLPLWSQYPALARLVGTLLVDVLDRVHELIGRAAADGPLLADHLEAEGVSLISVTPLGGDLHAGHAFVARCTFRTDSGREIDLVYKPRPCDGERFLHDLTRRLTASGTPIGVAPWAVACVDHGWMAHVTAAPADSVDDAREFFRQAGALAAVVYRTGGHDFHAENVIAVGGACIGIDAETVLAPLVADEDGLTTRETRSVIDAMIVPRWLRLRGAAVDMSALGCRLPEAMPHGAVLRWVQAGTADARVVVRREPSFAPLSPARTAAGAYWAAQDFTDDILDGFTKAWDALDVAARSGGAFTWIDDMAVRVLMRMTSTYGRVMQTSLEPALLRDGLARSIHLEHLCRPLLDGAERAGALALADAEIRFLERGTLPAFYARADSDRLLGSHGELLASFDTSAADHFRRRLADSDHARELQLQLIRASLAVSAPGVRQELVEREEREAWPAGRTVTTDVRETLEAIVDRYRLRDALADHRRPGLDTIDARQWGIEPWPPGFYSGMSGIAAWAFALANALDDGAIADAAERILAANLDRIVIDPARAVRRHGLSGQYGVSGMFVGWSVCAKMSDRRSTRERVVDGCRALVHAMVEQGVPPPSDADLLSGGAGLLGGLLSVDRLGVQVPSALRAVAVNAVAADPATECGFSHGNAGRIGVLAAAGARGWFDDTDVLARLVDDESARFDPATGNWPRSHAEAGGRPRTGWCNGFPGVALARSMLLRNTAAVSPAVRIDLERSLDAFGASPSRTDSLCCGLAGRAEILRYLREHPDRTQSAGGDDTGEARCEALYGAAVAELAERAAADRLRLAFPRESPIPSYGLFPGIGGVVYALAAHLADAPHILGWAPEP